MQPESPVARPICAILCSVGPRPAVAGGEFRRIERAIAELEREWNAAYSEESWAAWKAGQAATAKADAAATDSAGGEQ